MAAKVKHFDTMCRHLPASWCTLKLGIKPFFLFPPSKRFLNKILIYTILYPCQSSCTLVLWLPVFLALGDFKHHLWSCTHSHTCSHTGICSKITQRLRGGRRTTAAASSHKMSVGRHRWHRSRHNLSLIIYTVRLTVLMQRPEKIQPTNLICTQQP